MNTKSNQLLQTDEHLCSLGQQVVDNTQQAIANLKNRINSHFANACRLLLNCRGRAIVTGMGKSGHIGRKIAATLSSTGTPAFYMHPGEASHGDLGMITQDDVVIAISNSGSTEELLTILPLIKRLGVPLIVLTGNLNSPMAKYADTVLDISVEKEACPLDLAPTTSTTVTLVIGDALAIALLDAKGFTAEKFALSHPSGRLGRQLLLTVNDIMHSGKDLPHVSPETLLSDVLIEMTNKRLGMTTVVDDKKHLVGVFTDGDLRRTLSKEINLHNTTVKQILTNHCTVISSTMLATTAAKLMQDNKITSIVVVDDQQVVVGVVHIHDLLKAGVI